MHTLVEAVLVCSTLTVLEGHDQQGGGIASLRLCCRGPPAVAPALARLQLIRIRTLDLSRKDRSSDSGCTKHSATAATDGSRARVVAGCTIGILDLGGVHGNEASRPCAPLCAPRDCHRPSISTPHKSLHVSAQWRRSVPRPRVPQAGSPARPCACALHARCRARYTRLVCKECSICALSPIGCAPSATPSSPSRSHYRLPAPFVLTHPLRTPAQGTAH